VIKIEQYTRLAPTLVNLRGSARLRCSEATVKDPAAYVFLDGDKGMPGPLMTAEDARKAAQFFDSLADGLAALEQLNKDTK
jgi:hypothetical protein